MSLVTTRKRRAGRRSEINFEIILTDGDFDCKVEVFFECVEVQREEAAEN